MTDVISNIGTVTCNTAKELAKILKPLVGLSNHHVHNTRDFVEQLKEVSLKKEESMVSYDVTALFTSVPIPPVLKIIEEKLTKDKVLQQRTIMTIKHIIKLLEFCLRSTYFVFQGQHYEQVEGAAMGSPLSLIVANILWSILKQKTLKQHHIPQVSWRHLWMTYLSFGYNTQRRILPTHKCHRGKNTIHSWEHQSWWIITPSRHLGYSKRRWKFVNLHIQKTHSHQPIFAVGQPPCHCQQI